jgi:Protein of unknown function (DUF2804)
LTGQSKGIPWRGPGPQRPGGLPLPPARMPLLRGGRPLKRWTYVGVYDAALTVCACAVRVGPFAQRWWAVWDPGSEVLRDGTVLTRLGRVRVEPGSVRVRNGAVDIDLAVEPGPPVEVVSPHGDQYIWTRKQGGVRARGRVRLGADEHALDARAVVDESAGYHARETAWEWSAGVGVAADGRALAWNLVRGVHDAPTASERTVWVDGEPHEVGPVAFAADLSALTGPGGETLGFEQEAQRARDDNLLLVRSEYRQPFGRFAGVLPGGIELAHGYGVVERHAARW